MARSAGAWWPVKDQLTALRAEFDGIDEEFERTVKDRREAIEAHEKRLSQWDSHLSFLRREHSRIKEAIRVARQEARGIR